MALPAGASTASPATAPASVPQRFARARRKRKAPTEVVIPTPVDTTADVGAGAPAAATTTSHWRRVGHPRVVVPQSESAQPGAPFSSRGATLTIPPAGAASASASASSSPVASPATAAAASKARAARRRGSDASGRVTTIDAVTGRRKRITVDDFVRSSSAEGKTADQVFRLLRKRCPTLTWTRLFSAVLYVYDSVLSSRQALLHAFQAYDSDNHKTVAVQDFASIVEAIAHIRLNPTEVTSLPHTTVHLQTGLVDYDAFTQHLCCALCDAVLQHRRCSLILHSSAEVCRDCDAWLIRHFGFAGKQSHKHKAMDKAGRCNAKLATWRARGYNLTNHDMVVAALVKRFGPRRGGDDGASSAGSSASAHKRSKRRSATGGAAGAGAGAGVGTPTTPLHKRISPLSLAGSGGSSPSVAPRKHVIAGAATSSALAAAAAAGAPVAATGEPYIPSQPRPGQPMPYNTMAARPTVGNGAQSYSLPTPGLAPPVFVPTVAQHGMHAATTKPPAWGLPPSSIAPAAAATPFEVHLHRGQFLAPTLQIREGYLPHLCAQLGSLPVQLFGVISDSRGSGSGGSGGGAAAGSGVATAAGAGGADGGGRVVWHVPRATLLFTQHLVFGREPQSYATLELAGVPPPALVPGMALDVTVLPLTGDVAVVVGGIRHDVPASHARAAFRIACIDPPVGAPPQAHPPHGPLIPRHVMFMP